MIDLNHIKCRPPTETARKAVFFMNRKIIVFLFSVLFLISPFIVSPVQASKINPEDLKPTLPPFPKIRAIPKVPKISKNPIEQRLNSIKINSHLKENSLSIQAESSELTVWVDQSFSGTSDGTEGAPYKDIYTAISTPNVDGLYINIKPGTYDENSHDLIGSMKSKNVEFVGIASEKPVIKTEFVSCANKVIILTNIKVIGKTTAFNCNEGVSLDINNSDITADDDAIKLGGNPLIIAINTNLSASKKSLNLLDGALVELKDSQLTGSIVTGDHLLLSSEKINVQGSINTKSYPLLEIIDGTVNGSISTLDNMLLSANKLTLQGSLDVTDEAKIELIQSQISDSLRAGENLLLVSDNSDIQNNLMGGNQVLLEFNNGTLGGQMNLLNDALVSLGNAKINKSLNVLDTASISINNSQIVESILAGDDLLMDLDKTSITGSLNGKDRARINLKGSSVNNQVKLGNEALVSANNTQFFQTINSLNKTLLSLTSSKMKQMMIGDDSLIAIDKSTSKCSDSSKNGISTGARNLLAIQNSIINGCNNAIDVLEDTIISINLSTIINTSSDAVSYHGNLKVLQDLEGNVNESFNIENSIFSNITGYVVNLSGYDSNLLPKPKAKIYYNDFWLTQGLSQGISEFCESCTPNYNFDPQFKKPQTGDFHLLSNSPAIDAGNPASSYNEEPIPNGGRVDLGAYGNTKEATSKDTTTQKLPVVFIPGTYATTLLIDPPGGCPPQYNDIVWPWSSVIPRNVLPENIPVTFKLPECTQLLQLDSVGEPIPWNGYRLKVGTIMHKLNETFPSSLTYWKSLDPIDFYEAFKLTIERLGIPFWEFPYDWRLDMADNEERLKDFIRQKLVTLNGSPDPSVWTIKQVDIVGHSQGGILARNVVGGSDSTAARIRNAIYVGAPQYGLAKSYAALRTGVDVFDKLLPQDVQKMSQNSPAVYQLLPTEDYFIHYPNGYFKINDSVFTYQGMTSKVRTDHNGFMVDHYVPRLNYLANPDHWVLGAKDVNHYIIAGYNNETLGTLNLIGNAYIPLDVDGDGTVPVNSADFGFSNGRTLPTNMYAYYFKGINHDRLLADVDVLKCIVEIIFSPKTKPSCPDSKSIDDVLRIRARLYSPLHLHVYDEQNRHTGLNIGKFIETDIPGSKYVEYGDNKFVYLPYPGSYKFELEPYDNTGSFTLIIEKLQSDTKGNYQSKELSLFKDIDISTDVKSYILNVSNELDNITLKEEKSGLVKEISLSSHITTQITDSVAPVTSIQIQGEPGKDNWYKSSVIVSIESIDNEVGILETVYSLDSIKKTYNQPFNIIDEGIHRVESVATDKAGNKQPESTALSFGIDKTPSQIDIIPLKSIYKKGELLTAHYNDNLSGIDRAILKLDDKIVEDNTVSLDVSGKHTLSIKVSDKAGNVTQKQYEFTVVEYNILINNNDEFTNNRNTKLSFIYPDGTEKVRIDDRPFSTNDRLPLWQNVSQSNYWFLKGADGDKMVYAQFKDKSGKVSDVISDSIILDTRAPRGHVKIINNNKSNQVMLTLDATDNLSGISQMMISNNMAFSGASWQPYSKQIEWTLNPIGVPLVKAAWVFVRFKDGAGNVSITAMDWILIR